jgi:hypothetical protein
MVTESLMVIFVLQQYKLIDGCDTAVEGLRGGRKGLRLSSYN